MFQEPPHLKVKFVDSWHHCCEGLERSNLVLVDIHHFSSGSADSWIMILFSLQGLERSELMLANVTLLQKLYPTHMGTVTITSTKIFGTTYHQNFASLGTSVSSMANITFSLVYQTEWTHQPCHTFLSPLWIHLCKILSFYHSSLKQTLHSSCLSYRQQQWYLRDITHLDCENVVNHNQYTVCSELHHKIGQHMALL